jgi:hypothetical protein
MSMMRSRMFVSPASQRAVYVRANVYASMMRHRIETENILVSRASRRKNSF